MQVFLETERLALRRFTMADAGNLVSLDADPDVMRFVTGGQQQDMAGAGSCPPA